MTGLMLYAVVVGCALGGAAVLIDHAMAVAGRARRWVWIGAIAGNLTVVAVAWTSAAQPRTTTSSLFTGMAAKLGRFVVSSSHSLWTIPDRAYLLHVFTAIDPWARIAALSASAAALLLLVLGHVKLARLLRHWRGHTIDGTHVLLTVDDGPAVAGVFASQIVLPEWALALPSRELELLLAHERSHQRARDPLVVHLARLMMTAMPWNPAAWWMLSRLRLAIEIDCDARVCAAADDRAAYGELLLTVAARRSRRSLLVPALLEHSSALARRITAMCPREFRFSSVRVAAACALALFVITGAALLPMPTLRAAARQQDQQQANERPFGRGAYKPGEGGVTMPKVLKQVDPEYTQAAKDAKVQGVVTLNIVVEADGTVGEIRVVKSLDQQYGLDKAAIDAAQQWRFQPSTLDGKGVPVICQLEMEFRLR